MRKAFILASGIGLALAARATVVFWGDSFGDIGFGLAAQPQGAESVAFGDYAGALSQGIWRSSFVGAYSGRYARDVLASVYFGDEAGLGAGAHSGVVAIGDGALACSKGATNVVAIGTGACAGWCNVHDTTWINGQVYISEEDGIFVTDSPSRQFADAPVFYTNGCWTIRGNLHVIGEMTRADPGTGDVVDPLGAWSGDYDYYVDCRRGGDGNSGRLGRPFASITGAVARIAADLEGGVFTNGVPTVGVMRGAYEYPGTLPTNAFRFVAISGKGDTFIEPQSTNSCRRMSMPNGDVEALTEFRGFTFRGFDSDTSYSWHSFDGVWWKRSPFFLIEFRDCAFEEATYSTASGTDWYRQVFLFCVLDGCEVRPTVRVCGRDDGGVSNYGVNELFRGCEFHSCVIRMGTNTVAASSRSPSASSSCYFENCYVDIPGVGGKYTFKPNGSTVTGRGPGITNSTIRVGAYLGSGTGVNALPAAGNSIISVQDSTQAASGTSIYPAYGEVEYGDDLRPKDYSKRFFGYMSGNDRGLRNAILTDVSEALREEGYTNVAVRVLALRQPAIHDEAPSPAVGQQLPVVAPDPETDENE